MKTGEQIDLLNIGLMALSLLLAWFSPFELFLFSYAILGPLHYLTEINWLRDRQFFIKQQKWIWVFVAAVFIIAFTEITRQTILKSQPPEDLAWYARIGHAFRHHVILWVLLFSFVLVLGKFNKLLLAAAACVVLALLVLKYVPFAFIVVAVFLPTIIHVYVFTMLFMLYGSVSSKSLPGYLSVVLLLLVPAWIFFLAPADSTVGVSGYVRESFGASNFQVLTGLLTKVLPGSESQPFDLYSGAALRIQVFLAFCYTYHYLNWFSKTTVIGWHKLLTRRKSVAILLAWAASVAVYAYDYRLGFTCLSFLSLLHVVLEFPLNVHSIKGLLSRKTWSR